MFLRRIMMVVLPKCTHNSSSTFGLMTLVASLFLYFQNIPFQPFPQFRQFLLIYYYLDSLATLTSPIPPIPRKSKQMNHAVFIDLWPVSVFWLSPAASMPASRPRGPASCAVTWSTRRSVTWETCYRCRPPLVSGCPSSSWWLSSVSTSGRPTTSNKVNNYIQHLILRRSISTDLIDLVSIQLWQVPSYSILTLQMSKNLDGMFSH